MSLETLVKVTLVVELKPGDTGIPEHREIVERVRDTLVDVTKHDETIGWRVMEVLRP